MIKFYKNKGETPLQMLDRLRIEKPCLKSEKLSYAGRLDPLAEGLVLVLEGDENKEREKYLGLDKIYQTDILFGLETDTGDILGLIKNINNIKEDQKRLLEEKILKSLEKFKGNFEQKYPSFSSKTFKGISLFEYARKGQEVEDVKHQVSLYDIKNFGFRNLSSEDFYSKAVDDISVIKGDFRQKEILQKYKENFENKEFNFLVLSLEIKVSSGFYVRQFAMDLGKEVNLPALALKIRRTKVGDY